MTQDSQDPAPVTTTDAVVIGGGISGLAIAHKLARAGKTVRVIESSDRLGGAVKTELKDGFLCEAGPNSMLVKSEAVWNFIHELGLADSLVEANAIANKRFLVKNGKVVPLPQSPASGSPIHTSP